jgi:hypothetical protein
MLLASVALAQPIRLQCEVEGKFADAEAKAAIVAEFRSDLRKNLRLLLDLEDAILAGKSDEATAILAKVEELRDHAHEEMGVE